ncbi:MAG: hypothetical protein AAFW69_09180, partial [Pseudomonadota bacterium]
MRIGFLPLARATFDTDLAEDRMAAMLATLETQGHEMIGPRAPLYEPEAAEIAIRELVAEAIAPPGLDRLLILQITFTDAGTALAAARAFAGPLAIWAVPEPREGGRLRLNAFCGLNLASHALGLTHRDFGWLYAAPEGAGPALTELLAGARQAGRIVPEFTAAETPEGARVAETLRGRRIARVGAHPDGFATCAYDPAALEALAGVAVDEVPLDRLFEAARAVPEDRAGALRAEAEGTLDGLDAVDQAELDRSLRL